MKNLILSVAVMLVTGTTPLLANGNNNDPRATFANQFTGAQNVKWTELEGGFHRVLFTLNGTGVEAFYGPEAELLGTVRVLFYTQLPLRVMQTLENRITGAVIIEVREITTGDGTTYNILLEQKNKKYSLKIGSLGDILEKQKLR
jgi:hypothetical protein